MSDSRGGKNAASNELLVNASAGEIRVAILEQGQFTELYIERDSDRSVTGTVALGRVTRVLPGMQAAFVEIGLEKAAFLYVGDFMDENTAAEADEPRGRRRGRNTTQRRTSSSRKHTALLGQQQVAGKVLLGGRQRRRRLEPRDDGRGGKGGCFICGGAHLARHCPRQARERR